MRNLIQNPTVPYSEYLASSPMVANSKLVVGQYKGLLNLETGKFYIRVSDIGTEPSNVPTTWVFQTYAIAIEMLLKHPKTTTTQVHDEVGNTYILYSELF